jgi:GTP-binding protein
VETAGSWPDVHRTRRQALRGHGDRHPQRENDLVVNPIKGKQLTNVRASGTDEAVRLVPRWRWTLESASSSSTTTNSSNHAQSIRIRKRLLTDNERRRAAREG